MYPVELARFSSLSPLSGSARALPSGSSSPAAAAFAAEEEEGLLLLLLSWLDGLACCRCSPLWWW